MQNIIVDRGFAGTIRRMDREDARRMPTLFGTAGREGQAFAALAWMEGGNKSRLDVLLERAN